MDIRRLEIFCKVIELKSFTRAAEAVRLSQPTVSESIRQLEDTLGQQLLDRLGREVQPTGAGRLLYRHARRLLQLRDETLQAMADYRGRLTGTLALGASTIPGAYLLPPFLESFRRQHPGIPLLLRISSTAAIADELLDGGLELAVLGDLWREQGLECEEVFSDELVLAVGPDHPWSGRESVTLAELAGEPFILRERGSGTRQVMSRVFREQGLDPERLTVAAEMGSSEAVRQGIRSGIGISVLSRRAVAEDAARGCLAIVPISGLSIRRPFYLAVRRNRRLSPLGRAFREHLLASAAAKSGAPAGSY